MESLLVSFSTVAIAEMGDRTQLLSLMLAAHYRRPWAILAGVVCATLANHALAGIVGMRLGSYLTPAVLDTVVGVSMVGMALWTLKPDTLGEEAGRATRASAFLATLVAFFIAEIGDKTQIATAALAAAYSNLFAVVGGTSAGMVLANAPGVFLGKAFADRLPLKTIHYVASGLFLVVGAVFIFRGLHHANPQSPPVIISGNARFEFLTPSLVRMEYSPSAKFVDAPTAVVQKRGWPEVPVRSTQKDGWLTAASSVMTLRYRLQSGPFSAANLEVTWRDPAGAAHAWHPGDVDHGNLGGLTYSLDNVSAANLPQGRSDAESPVNDMIPGIDVPLAPAKPGLLSRSGYAFIDDSETPVWSASKAWIEPRPQPSGQDWYLFAYDRDYRKVLGEYAQLCGPIPMIPRWVLGPWITDFNFEYFPDSAESRRPEFERYNQPYLEAEVSRLRQSHIPFDALVLDFAWHNYGWDGGYDWSPLIPHSQELLRGLHRQGIKVSLNDHPGYANTEESILSFSDSHAPGVLQALGRPLPAKPTFDLDVSRQWRFRRDPRDEGIEHRWYASGYERTRYDGDWKPIGIGPWQEQGYGSYGGTAWYRASVPLPAKLPGTLYLYLGEVDGTYRIFVNGREASHSPVHWPQRLSYTDLTPYLRAGERNEIVLRIQPGVHGNGSVRGGIIRGPVAIRDVAPPKRIYFDLSDRQQAEVFMRELHEPLMQEGVDVWWVDGGSGAVDMPGLNKQLWTNKVFYDYTQRRSGQRAFLLGRYGDWGSERYPAYFTGDTYSQWPVLAYEVAFTTRGGNVLVPYITHDIGGFHGARLDFDLYARWIEFGTFSPLLRLHSAHANPREGNMRMPWVYGSEGIALMRKYFRLRTQLIPYLYSYAQRAHDESLPILRPLYLVYPDLDEAYRHSHEYFFGGEMLVAPVLEPSGDQTIYLPPGRWVDFFTRKRYQGGVTFTSHYAVDETPVFVREGALIPEQTASDYSDERPLDTLILDVFGVGEGSFDLYEDDGVSLEYAKGAAAHTAISHTTDRDGLEHLRIGPTRGAFEGQVEARAYELRIHAADKPSFVSVDGRETGGEWKWDSAQATAIVELPKRSIREPISVEWR
ncbi:MAG TPA: TMEM165/GDT1 family protein [Steroidobacteraceae bacterium]|nr:TMEM165/GDT1 family protein [Steroidobacteraceae bacterium]